MLTNTKYSRPLATAARVKNVAEDHHRFLNKRVLLTGESTVLVSANGRVCFLSSLRLLVRVCEQVSVWIPAELKSLWTEARAIANQIEPSVEFLDQQPEYERYDSILSIGIEAHADLPWTVINSNGWLARISSGSTQLPSDCEQANPIAALAASSLGVSEVFKRLIRLKEARGKFFNGLSFSLYSYSLEAQELGPPLPKDLSLNALMVGAGAINNGTVYLLSELPVSGNISIVDRQKFGDENFGTCLLMGPLDVGTEKARFAADFLDSRLAAKGYAEDFSAFSKRLGVEIPYPTVVINGLDNIDARHEVQRALWPDLILDGAIGDFGCQVSRHPWSDNVACLICLFRHPPGEPAEQVTSRLTGLSTTRTKDALSTITEEDVLSAPMEKRGWLRERVGRQVCSIIEEAVAKQLSDDIQRDHFEPSVPFVACFSACMVVGELVKFLAGSPTPLEPRFQFDMLRGPSNGEQFPQERRPDCICTTRRRNIDLFRNSMKAA